MWTVVYFRDTKVVVEVVWLVLTKFGGFFLSPFRILEFGECEVGKVVVSNGRPLAMTLHFGLHNE